LTVPPGALSTSVRISIVDLGGDANDPRGYHIYDLGPSGTFFSPAATIDLPAPAADSTQTVVIEVIPLTTGLIMLDMVQLFDVASTLNPNGITFAGCNPTDYYGICFSFMNPSTTQTVTTAEVRIAPWQCYSATNDPPPGTAPGDHCDFTGLLIPCTPADLDLTPQLPVGGLPPGGIGHASINLTAPILAGCLGSSFVGVDALFREPDASHMTVGIRSAKDGPRVCTNASCTTTTLFQGIYPLKKFNQLNYLIEDFLIAARF